MKNQIKIYLLFFTIKKWIYLNIDLNCQEKRGRNLKGKKVYVFKNPKIIFKVVFFL